MADPRGMDLHRDLRTLTALAQDDIRKAMARARTPQHARAILGDLLPMLIEQYGGVAAAMAADWYDEVREQAAARGAFGAVVPAPTPDGTQALLGWAVDESTDLVTFQTLVLGGSVRRILNYGRNVVSASAIADPGADGWQRQGVGANCPFCNFLIGRGAVYSEGTVRFASHDHCNCVAVAAFKGAKRPVLLDKDGKRLTTSGRASRTDAEKRKVDNERIRAWIEANPNVG